MRNDKKSLGGAVGSIFSAVGSLAEAVEKTAEAISTTSQIADNLSQGGVYHSQGWKETSRLEALMNTQMRLKELEAEAKELGIDLK